MRCTLVEYSGFIIEGTLQAYKKSRIGTCIIPIQIEFEEWTMQAA